MVPEGFDLFSRFQGILEIFGYGGLLVVLCFVAVVVGFTFVRGLGLLLLTLLVSYSLGAITTGGVIFLSTVIRWGCLILLGISFIKYFEMPSPSLLLLIFYALLGLGFSVFSPAPSFSMQQSILLLATILCTSVAISSYVTSFDAIGRLFVMGIAAASVWTASNLLLAREFILSPHLRYSTDTAVSAVSAAYAGAFFVPMVVWGIVQKKSSWLRLYSVLLIVPFLFILILTGVRSALFGMTMIAILPLILLKVRFSKVLVYSFIFAVVGGVSLLVLYSIMPDKAGPLVERIFSMETTGRTERWAIALRWCFENALIFGKGIGSTNIIARRDFNISFHNSFFDIWGNTGFIGMLAVVFFLLVYIKKGFNLLRICPSEETAAYSRILLGYMLGISAMSLVESFLSSASTIGIFMLIVTAALIDKLRYLIDIDHYLSLNAAEDVHAAFPFGEQEGDYDFAQGYPPTEYPRSDES